MKSLLLYISLGLLVFKTDVASVRIAYRDASTSKEKAFVLHKELENISEKDNTTVVAYKGAVAILTSQYFKKVKIKKVRFVKGATLIEYAVKKQPKNIEIRFIRLSIQQNIPKFLKYNLNINSDKEFILSNYKQIKSKVLKNYIKDYILESEFFTTAEKNVISQP
jgi:hypothetical protein